MAQIAYLKNILLLKSKLRFEVIKGSERQRLTLLRLQSWTKYLEKSKDTKQNWTGIENFDFCFCVIFDCYYLSLISGRKTGE